MFSSRNALMALAMPGLAAYAQTAESLRSIAPAVPVVFRSDWTPTTNTSSDNPEEWTGRFDLDIIHCLGAHPRGFIHVSQTMRRVSSESSIGCRTNPSNSNNINHHKSI